MNTKTAPHALPYVPALYEIEELETHELTISAHPSAWADEAQDFTDQDNNVGLFEFINAGRLID